MGMSGAAVAAIFPMSGMSGTKASTICMIAGSRNCSNRGASRSMTGMRALAILVMIGAMAEMSDWNTGSPSLTSVTMSGRTAARMS